MSDAVLSPEDVGREHLCRKINYEQANGGGYSLVKSATLTSVEHTDCTYRLVTENPAVEITGTYDDGAKVTLL